MTEALDRVPADEAGPGDIVAVAGIPDITIGETLADPDDPRPLPLITVDEPAISMTIGINTSPLAGQDGHEGHRPAGQGPARRRARRQRVDPGAAHRAARHLGGPGPRRAQLAVLVEMMRREGFELTVGKPQVVTREIDGKLHEPVERLTIDVPEEYLGVVTQLLALRKGRLEQMVNHGTGWVRMDYLVPARGLIGFRTEFLTETRGTGIAAPRLRGLRAVGRRAAHPRPVARGRPAGAGDCVRADRPAGARHRCSWGRATRCTRA